MNKIILDCDNTMGLQGCDVDDGLAFLYLLGRDDVELLGVTTTFANSDTETVYKNTQEMFDELNIKKIPLLKGALSPHNRNSEAAVFLVEMVNNYPGEVTLLGIGSLTNFLGAHEIDCDFFKKVKRIVLMGGITEELIVNGTKMNELNFSVDSEAAFNVLKSQTDVTVITGNLCLQATFGEKEYMRLRDNGEKEIYSYINRKTRHWFEHFMKKFGVSEFYNWDAVAAVYATTPELFDKSLRDINSSSLELERGCLALKKENTTGHYTVNIPSKILDIDQFNTTVFEAWGNVKYS